MESIDGEYFPHPIIADDIGFLNEDSKEMELLIKELNVESTKAGRRVNLVMFTIRK